jgi:hypothetical protein
MRYRFTSIPTPFTGAIAGDGYGTVSMVARFSVSHPTGFKLGLTLDGLKARIIRLLRIRPGGDHCGGLTAPLGQQHWHWQLHRWQVQHN